MAAPSRSLSSALSTLAALSLLLAACVSAAPKTTSLRLKGKDYEATVTVDDQYLGSFAYVLRKGVALPPGKHRITVQRLGYFPWDKLVEVREGDPPVNLPVELVKIPD